MGNESIFSFQSSGSWYLPSFCIVLDSSYCRQYFSSWGRPSSSVEWMISVSIFQKLLCTRFISSSFDIEKKITDISLMFDVCNLLLPNSVQWNCVSTAIDLILLSLIKKVNWKNASGLSAPINILKCFTNEEGVSSYMGLILWRCVELLLWKYECIFHFKQLIADSTWND